MTAALLGMLAGILGAVVLPLRQLQRLPHGPRRNERYSLPAAPASADPTQAYSRLLSAAYWLAWYTPPSDEQATRELLLQLRAAIGERGLQPEELPRALGANQLRADMRAAREDLDRCAGRARVALPLERALALVEELAGRPWVQREQLRGQP